MTLSAGTRWVRFLRQYGPIPRNDNMYDEHIRNSARRVGIRPLAFAHPLEAEILALPTTLFGATYYLVLSR